MNIPTTIVEFKYERQTKFNDEVILIGSEEALGRTPAI